jgi:hypothetical protein
MRIGGQYGAKPMYLDHDQMAIVRTQLSEQLALLQLTSFDTNPVPYFMRLENLRQMAQSHDFPVVADIAAMYEDALQRVAPHNTANVLIENFNTVLEDAIGCAELSAAATESFLASVAMRLRP